MTGRETVAAALIAQMNDGAVEWAKLSHLYREFALGLADAAFASITLVAAEHGWQMRPDEAGPDMYDAGRAVLDKDGHMGDVYLAMLADPTAQFEWDK